MMGASSVRVEFLTQPPFQVGVMLDDLIGSEPGPSELVIISAFANRHTLLRLRDKVQTLVAAGTRVKVVIGIDLNGTSEESLREILAWGVDARVMKNRYPGHTFHPKVYVVEHAATATVIVGSNNLTEGGFFSNYEAATLATFDLPTDAEEYQSAREELGVFLDPIGDDVLRLDEALIETLKKAGMIRPEAEARRRKRKEGVADFAGPPKGPNPFGVRDLPPPPSLPKRILDEVIKRVSRDRRTRKRANPAKKKVVVRSTEELSPTYFFMELTPVQSANTPGETRIPLRARDAAEEFWGWPEKYRAEMVTRGKIPRRYWNWKPRWRVVDGAGIKPTVTEDVRMYLYEASADFRFYSPALVNMGADEGDIVRIERVSDWGAEYECTVARKGTPLYDEWLTQCTEAVQGSQRHFGYA
jgi:HKD family nuclease